MLFDKLIMFDYVILLCMGQRWLYRTPSHIKSKITKEHGVNDLMLPSVIYVTLIKSAISSKEDDEQFKSNLKNFYLLNKIRHSYMAVKDELRNKS